MGPRQCAKCGITNVSVDAIFCPSCGAKLDDRTYIPAYLGTSAPTGIIWQQLLAFAGSIILFVGVFMPIITVPIIGSVNYFQNGRGDGVIILILAVFSFLLAVARKYQLLLLTGIVSLSILAFTFVGFQYRMNQMHADMEAKLADNPFAGIGQAMLGSIQLSWGFAVLVIGAICLIGAALLKGQEPDHLDRPNPLGSLSRISNRSVFVALALILIGWLVFLMYSHGAISFADGFSRPSPSSTPSTNSNQRLEEAFKDSRRATDEAMSTLSISPTPSIPSVDAPTISVPKFDPLPTPLQPRRAKIISENANFRFSPEAASEVLDVVPYGEEVEITKQKGPWFQVKYMSQLGWVHGNTIRILEAYE